MLKIIANGFVQAGMGEVVRRMRRDRFIAAREFMLALRACFDLWQAALYPRFNGLIIAQLKMQKRLMLKRAPITPVKRVRTNKVQRRCNRRAVPLCDDEDNLICECVMDLLEKGAR